MGTKYYYKRNSGYKIHYKSKSGESVSLHVGKFLERKLERLVTFSEPGPEQGASFEDKSNLVYFGARISIDGNVQRFVGGDIYEELNNEKNRQRLEQLKKSRASSQKFLQELHSILEDINLD